ncbi:MAG: ABC transporter permease [Ilumatobacter sp.]|uniref:ABC transporter permease n=1 Tax=Ilumatobacter sp. TaxID=1967498 RepID=UPI0026311D33|nr:ABC transporter permease [Ilumatobacter sp.]MDJ0770259.1 ABC transporter permease [Ilumatobacter sp.]
MTIAAVRAWESHFTLYRTIWKSNLLGAFVQPLLYLLGMGLGVGALVDRGDDADRLLDGLTYFEFLAPGLLATTAMMVCTNEALWPVMGGFKWMRGFHAQAASPLSPGQVAAGVALWHATKAVISVAGVAAVLVLFEGTRSFGLLLAVVFGALTGVAFAAPATAWSASREVDYSFPTILRFVIMPLFLFGGAFYPIEQLPDWMEPIAKVTPLWHGVELCRGAVHDRLEWGSALVHVAFLVSLAAIGWILARRSFGRRLHL